MERCPWSIVTSFSKTVAQTFERLIRSRRCSGRPYSTCGSVMFNRAMRTIPPISTYNAQSSIRIIHVHGKKSRRGEILTHSWQFPRQFLTPLGYSRGGRRHRPLIKKSGGEKGKPALCGNVL